MGAFRKVTGPAPLAVVTAPTGAQTGTVGSAFSATATASGGSGSYTYQWKKGTTNVPNANGGNTATLNFTSLVSGDTGSYTVVVDDGTNTVTSSAITLTVNAAPPPKPVFSAQPTAPTAAIAGQSFTTSPAVAASGSPTFKWQSASGASGGTFTDVSGATGTTLTVANPVVGTMRYKAVATNATGTTDSNILTVVTSAAPTVTAASGTPTAITGTAGGTVPWSELFTFGGGGSADWSDYNFTATPAAGVTFTAAGAVVAAGTASAASVNVVATNKRVTSVTAQKAFAIS